MPSTLNTKILSDVEIANKATLRPIIKVAADLGLDENDIDCYGKYKSKISYSAIERIFSDKKSKRGKLILVTAITPTKAGDGKTTSAIGLAQALRKRGHLTAAALREPSMGPVFGQKGGGTGGGYSQLMPMGEINLHFTGDIHAISAANNLLASLVDNHIHFGNSLEIDPRAITFRRAIDMNDRSLRNLVQGVGGKSNGVLRETAFDITAASEVMAILCLADSLEDLRKRLGKIVIGRSMTGKPILAKELDAANAMTIILKDALRPNIVQTLDGTPAFVHGGPFANIAHGTSSVLSTMLALRCANFVITEGGFGADLGFEKYCDIVATTQPDLSPDAVVMVVTTKALKLHGGIPESNLRQPNLKAIEKGFANLERHVSNVETFGLPAVICLNKYAGDSDEELKYVLSLCKARGYEAAIADVWAGGGDGATDLAVLIEKAVAKKNTFAAIYKAEDSITEKLEKIATKIYRADSVEYSASVKKDLKWLNTHGYGNLPVCVAKTQYSFSDNPKLIGAPIGFNIKISQLRLSAGAGFVVAIAGDIMTMPGLPKRPASVGMAIDEDGKISSFY